MQKSEKLPDKLVELVELKSKGFRSPVEFFMRLRQEDFSRLELMILDSAIKKMPMENLYNILLLPKNNYNRLIDNLIEKLSSFKN
jgi:hypothetical protein